MKQKILFLIKQSSIKWRKFYLEPEEKLKICNLEKEHASLFYYPEHMNYTTDILKNITEKTDWDNFFSRPFEVSRLKKDSSDPDDIQSRVIVFYGDYYGYFTENIDLISSSSLIINFKSSFLDFRILLK